MQNVGFKRSQNDYCLYSKNVKNGMMYVLLYVDDVLIFGNDKLEVAKLKAALNNQFHMKDLGLVSNFLGLNITQNIDVDVTIISQKNYLTQVLERYDMSDCNGSSTPINKNFDFNTLKREKSESHEIETKCRQLTGSLMYATIGTRPDLCSTVMFLSRFQSGANQQLYKALKQELRYVKETIDLCLIYKKTNRKDIMVGYVDADWGGDVIDRKSTTGYCYLLFGNVISWCCEK